MGLAMLYNGVVQPMTHGSEVVVQPMVDGKYISHARWVVQQHFHPMAHGLYNSPQRGVEKIRRGMKGRDGDVERQLGKAGDEGNKGTKGGV